MVHQQPGEAIASCSLEVKDAHSKELLASRTDPAYSAHTSHRLVEDISLVIRATLLELLDPDPF